MSKVFTKAAFIAAFEFALSRLANAEKITKLELQDLSRSTLNALHVGDIETHGDIQYVNRLVNVLSPVNKRMAILFFKEFTGFRFDDKTNTFLKKDKKNYDEVKVKTIEWLEDPLNNIWVWAERNLEIEPKEFDMERLQKGVESILKKAEKNNFTQLDVLKAIMAAGVTVDSIIELMNSLPGVELVVNEE